MNQEITKSKNPEDFVILTDIIPEVILEIRYFTTYNFVGDQIDGYEEPIALLTKEAANRLKKVSDELLKKGYRLKIYDAYRPRKSVSHFLKWADDLNDQRMKEYFYPDFNKALIFEEGYLAKNSAHSRGSTIDLTLFDMKTGKDVDMGGTFDFFGDISNPDYDKLTKIQKANRSILKDIMIANGFKQSLKEWWHFVLIDEPFPNTYFDFPINSKYIK